MTSTGQAAPAKSEKDDLFQKVFLDAQTRRMEKTELSNFYDRVAHIYDKGSHTVELMGPHWAAEYLANSGVAKDAKVLDCAAGSGIVAEFLRARHGFTGVIEGFDGSQNMLDKAALKKVYQKTYCCFVGDGHKLPMADNTYDCAVMAGGLAKGHIKLDAFLEYIRVVKPGGVIVNAFREETRKKVEEYKHYDEYMRDLEAKGLWEYVVEDVKPNYYMGLEGLVNVWRVL